MSGTFTTQYDQQINDAAANNGIDPTFLKLQLEQESGLNNDPSGGNGGGIGQFIPGTAASYGVDTTDAVSGINGAAAYDSDLLAKTGSYTGVLNSYGTVPTSGATVPGQVAVLNQAQSLDSGSSGFNLLTGTPVGSGGTPELPGGNGDTTTTASGLDGSASSAASAVTPGGSSIGSLIQTYITRFAAIIVGVVFVGIGLSFLKPGLLSGVAKKGAAVIAS